MRRYSRRCSSVQVWARQYTAGGCTSSGHPGVPHGRIGRIVITSRPANRPPRQGGGPRRPCGAAGGGYGRAKGGPVWDRPAGSLMCAHPAKVNPPPRAAPLRGAAGKSVNEAGEDLHLATVRGPVSPPKRLLFRHRLAVRDTPNPISRGADTHVDVGSALPRDDWIKQGTTLVPAP